MEIGYGDINTLTDGLTRMLWCMREYQRLTVLLLNSEIEEADGYLQERQRLIDDVNGIEREIHRILYRATGADDQENFGRALGKLTLLADKNELSAAVAVASQLTETFRDISVIDEKLLSSVKKQRDEMIAKLKSVADRRRVAHTPYFDPKTQPIGSAYDKKK